MGFTGVIGRKIEGIPSCRAFKLQSDNFNDMCDGMGTGVTGTNNAEPSRRARDDEPFPIGEVIGLRSVIRRTDNRCTVFLNGWVVLAEERYSAGGGADHRIGRLVELTERVIVQNAGCHFRIGWFDVLLMIF